MKKVPDYDPQHRPYVLFKDSDYISLFNTRLMKLLPLVRSKYDMNPLNVHNLSVTNYTKHDKRLDREQPINLKNQKLQP